MKKILSFAVASALAFAQPYTAYCTELIEVTPVSDAYTIAISGVSADGTVTNGKFTVTYDSSKMELADFRLTGLSGTMNVVNTKEPGKIVVAFASSSPINVSLSSLMEITFSYYPSYINDLELISIEVNELITEDENGEDVKLSPDDLIISSAQQQSPRAEITDTVYDTDGNASVYVQLADTPPFTNGLLEVKYDASAATFSGGEACGILESAICEIYESEPGTVKIAFISSEPVMKFGPAVKLSFTGVNDDSLQPSVSVEEFYRIDEDGTQNRICVFPAGEYMNDIFPGTEGFTEISVNPGTENNTAVITLSENSNITNGLIAVHYDSSLMKFESGRVCDKFSSTMAEIYESEPGLIKIAFVSVSEITEGGDFIELHFSPIKAGTFDITLKAEEFVQMSADGTEKTVSCILNDGTVNIETDTPVVSEVTASEPEVTTPVSEITSSEPEITTTVTASEPAVTTPVSEVTSSEPEQTAEADVNENGIVTSSDLLSLIRIVLGNEEKTSSADINGDGKTDSADVLLLIKLLSK